MHMAVNDAGHDELATKVRDLSLKIGQAGFVTYVYKLSVLYCQCGCLRVLLVGSEDFSVFDDLICFHGLSVLI